MKKFITAAALLAASTALANAATVTFSSTGTVSGNSGGSYSGVAFTLGGTDTTRFTSDYVGTLPETLELSSISVQWRGNNTSDYSDRYLYIIDSNYEVLAISDLCSSTGLTGTGTFSFSAQSSLSETENVLTLRTDATYYAHFAVESTITQYVTIGEAMSSAGAFNSCNLAMIGGKDSATAAQWSGITQQSTLESTTYIPQMTIVATAIPEPSAFGLLAGVGALALVAARRRRSRAK